MKKLILILLIVIASATKQSFAENKHKMDSLKMELKKAKSDTAKLRIYEALCNECDVKNNLLYALPEIEICDKLLKQYASGNIRNLILKKKAIAYECCFYYYNNEKGRFSNEAQEYLKKELEIYTEIKDDEGIKNTMVNLSIYYSNSGNLFKSLEILKEGYVLMQKHNYRRGEARFIKELATLYARVGDTTQALTYLKKGNILEKEINDTTRISQRLVILGQFYVQLKRFNQALECYRKAMFRFRNVNDNHNVALCYWAIGQTFKEWTDASFSVSNLDSSLHNFQKSKQLFITNNEIDFEMGTLLQIGKVYRRMNLDEKAKECFEEYIAYCNNYYKEQSVANALGYSALAKLYFAQSNYKLAKKYSDLNLKISYDKDGINERLMEDEQLAFNIDSCLGNFKASLKHLRQFIVIKNTLNDASVHNEAMREKFQSDLQNQRLIDQTKSNEEIAKQRIVRNAFIVSFGLILLIAILIYRSLRQNRKAKSIIENQKHLVEEKNQEILDSIEYAKRIQFTLLASDELLQQNLPEHFLMFQPKDIVSGDFYWATKKENRFYLAVCDSTGHGVPGAFMSLLNATFLNEAINEKNIAKPHQILNHVRQRLVASIGSDGAQDGMDCTLLCFDKTTNNITYSAAYHKPILFLNNHLIELDGDKIPVGQSEKMETFTLRNIPISLEKERDGHGIIYLFTDGYADQFGGPKGKKYSKKKFKEILLSIKDLPMNEQREALYNAHIEWRNNQEQVDDICVIGVRV